MLWVGLTGGLGTGKSTVSAMLKQINIPVIDADLIANQVLELGEPSYLEVLNKFGREILNSDQSLNRKKLADIVFKNPEKLKILENIVHPAVKMQVQQQKDKLVRAKSEMAFYDIPLLFEKKLQSEFDKILVVTCDEKLQRERLRLRNNWSDIEINQRLNVQLPMIEKIKLADFVIYNNSNSEDLESEVVRTVSLLRLMK